ncbi:hypothetical protein HC928_23475 [bacterium]|nr:hypothetical protein [bacterium]
METVALTVLVGTGVKTLIDLVIRPIGLDGKYLPLIAFGMALIVGYMVCNYVNRQLFAVPIGMGCGVHQCRWRGSRRGWCHRSPQCLAALP